MVEIDEYIKTLVDEFPSIMEVWLFGSRANLSYTKDSDWDLFVFANEYTLQKLNARPEYNNPKIDLLVVIDGDLFEEPWPIDRPKKDKLSNWDWKRLSETEAKYFGTKDPLNGGDWWRSGGSVLSGNRKAKRLWP